MSTFAYIALSKDGSRKNGTLVADNRAAALAQMSRQGLQPVKIDEAKDAKAAAKKAKSPETAKAGKVSQKSVESFTRELANLLAGGVPLSRSLQLLRREASVPAAKHLWSAIHDDVVGGTSFGDALAKFPKTFSNVYIAMVRAGEAGGFLDVVLGQIAEFRTREADLKGKVRGAMIYPIILGVSCRGRAGVHAHVLHPALQHPSSSSLVATCRALRKAIIGASNILEELRTDTWRSSP